MCRSHRYRVSASVLCEVPQYKDYVPLLALTTYGKVMAADRSGLGTGEATRRGLQIAEWPPECRVKLDVFQIALAALCHRRDGFLGSHLARVLAERGRNCGSGSG